MCDFANCPGRQACLLAETSPCLESNRLDIMEQLAQPSRRRTKSGRGFAEIADAFANLDEMPANVVRLRGD